MYSIMRTVKHKATGGSLKASLQHLYRERETPNADDNVKNMCWPEQDGAQTSENALRKLHAKIDEVVTGTGRKLRKDAVVAVEYVMTASPEYFQQFEGKELQRKINEFAVKSREWIASQYPDGKIIAAQVHMDETTPHVSLFVTPTFKNKNDQLTFSAKTRLGGRQLLSEHQDSFSKKMEPLGLKRGIKGSKASHEKVSRFYAKVVKSVADVENIYTEDAKKIDDLASGFNKKLALAEYAKELAHDNLKLRHVISERDTQKQIENIKKVHEEELHKIRSELSSDIKTLRAKITPFRLENDVLKTKVHKLESDLQSETASLKMAEQEHKKELRQIKESSFLNANFVDQLEKSLNTMSDTSDKKVILEYINLVRFNHIESAVESGMVTLDHFTKESQDFYEEYSQNKNPYPKMRM